MEFFLRSRETVLSACALIIVILFSLTGMIARAYHVKLHGLAGQWFAAGEAHLASGNASQALADFRNALVYEPEDTRIQFRLAQALMAENRDEEARSYLLGLLAHSPSDAAVNLALARLATKLPAESEALRYYHGAIYGVWPESPQENRLNARLELCRFLISRNDGANADGELIALESEIPAQHSAALHKQVGDLFLSVGDATRALGEFRRILTTTRPPAGAVRGAGLSAYQLGNFRVAERYLDRANRLQPNDSDVVNDLETSRLALEWDPYLRGLTEVQRHDRVRHDFAQALARIQSCMQNSPQSDLVSLDTQAKAVEPGLSERSLARHPEQLDTAMNLVFSIEASVAQKCGAPEGLDKALLVLGNSRQGVDR